MTIYSAWKELIHHHLASTRRQYQCPATCTHTLRRLYSNSQYTRIRPSRPPPRGNLHPLKTHHLDSPATSATIDALWNICLLTQTMHEAAWLMLTSHWKTGNPELPSTLILGCFRSLHDSSTAADYNLLTTYGSLIIQEHLQKSLILLHVTGAQYHYLPHYIRSFLHPILTLHDASICSLYLLTRAYRLHAQIMDLALLSFHADVWRRGPSSSRSRSAWL